MDPQSPYLQLTTESVNGHQVIVVTGEFDLCTSPVLHDYLRDAAGSPGEPHPPPDRVGHDGSQAQRQRIGAAARKGDLDRQR